MLVKVFLLITVLVTSDVSARYKENMYDISKLSIVLVNQAVINLSGFYLRSVLSHISQFNAFLDHFISVILVKFKV